MGTNRKAAVPSATAPQRTPRAVDARVAGASTAEGGEESEDPEDAEDGKEGEEMGTSPGEDEDEEEEETLPPRAPHRRQTTEASSYTAQPHPAAPAMSISAA
ncbi:MAG: hypothetical protein JO181_12470, partial [Solirubrobacterales bacterium]|nr:hypothetical protein [Solirubrobacterales bacterium]